MVATEIPDALAASAATILSPLYMTHTFLLVFLLCMAGVAHLQLPGPYPRLLFILSMLMPGRGMGPMSCKKLEKLSQDESRVTPLAP
jgi:hypothetical protein